MANSPRKGKGIERWGSDENANEEEIQSIGDEAFRTVKPSSPKLTVEMADGSVNDPEPSHPVREYGRTESHLSKQEMEELRQFGGDDYICVQTTKTNAEAHQEMDEVVLDFGETVSGNSEEARDVVFCNTDFAIVLVGKKGCRLGFSDGSAFLDIPEGALDEDKVIYMHKLPQGTDVTGPEDRRITSYSPLIVFGPEGTVFKKDVTVNFEHCAAQNGARLGASLAVFGRENEANPWIRQKRGAFAVKGKRVEHYMRQFSQRCYGCEEAERADRPPMRMCLMLAVPARRQFVEAVLMRDEISLINAHRDNLIHARSFAENEIHVIRDISIDPTQHVVFDGTAGSRHGPSDWNTRGHYAFIMRASPAGRFELSLRQTLDQTVLADISISEEGDVGVRTEGLGVEPRVQDAHLPTEAQDDEFGRMRVPCPDFARPFAERRHLQSFDGNALSRRERERVLRPPLVLHERGDSTDSGVSHTSGDDLPVAGAEGGGGRPQREPRLERLLVRMPALRCQTSADSGCACASDEADNELAFADESGRRPSAERILRVPEAVQNQPQQQSPGKEATVQPRPLNVEEEAPPSQDVGPTILEPGGRNEGFVLMADPIPSLGAGPVPIPRVTAREALGPAGDENQPSPSEGLGTDQAAGSGSPSVGAGPEMAEGSDDPGLTEDQPSPSAGLGPEMTGECEDPGLPGGEDEPVIGAEGGQPQATDIELPLPWGADTSFARDRVKRHRHFSTSSSRSDMSAEAEDDLVELSSVEESATGGGDDDGADSLSSTITRLGGSGESESSLERN